MNPLPHNTEIEKEILASLMKFPEKALDLMEGTIRPFDFYSTFHQHMYTAILGMDQIDFTLVSDEVIKESWFKGHAVEFAEMTGEFGYTGNMLQERLDRLLEMSELRQAITLCTQTAESCYSANGNAKELLNSLQTDLIKISVHRGLTSQSAEEGVNVVYDQLETPDLRRGLKTSIPSIDSQMDFVGGQLITIAGRPSMGKSSLMRNIAQNFCEYGSKVGIFSLEMSLQAQMLGFLSQTTGINGLTLKRALRSARQLNDKDWLKINQSRERIAGWDMMLDEQAPITIAQFKHKARLMKKEGVNAIFIDQLNKIQSGEKLSMFEEASKCTIGVGNIARELDIPIFLLAQLNRSVENNKDSKPHLSNLKMTGSLEEESEAVLFVYRKHYYTKALEDQNLGTIIIAKNRNGSTGEIPCNWDAGRTKFTELAENEYTGSTADWQEKY